MGMDLCIYTWEPKIMYPSWAKAKKTMKNMTAKPATSPAHLPRVLASWVIVLLKEMYLNSFTHEKNTQMATADLNMVPRYPRDVKSA